MFNIKIKILSVIMAALIILSGANVLAAWDGFVPAEVPAEEKYTLKIVDMNNIRDIIGAGAIPSGIHTFSSKYSAHWYRHAANMNLNFYNIPSDWSEVETLEIPIYSEVATKSKTGVYVYCRDKNGKNSGYQYTSFAVDWEGEKLLKLNLKDFSAVNGADLSKVYRLRITVDSNYSGTLHKDTSLFIGSITGKLVNHEENERLKKEFADIMSGGAALLDYSTYMMHEDKVVPVDNENGKAVLNVYQGVKFLPVSFFKNWYSDSFEEKENKCIVNKNGNTLEFSKDDINYKLNGKNLSFPIAPFLRNGMLYVPCKESVEALGGSAKNFGQVTILGNNTVSACEKDSEITETIEKQLGSYVPDASEVTSEDFEEIRLNWRKSLVGDENNDLTNPFIKANVESIESKAKSSYALLNYGDDRDKKFTLFGDKTVTETADMGDQYTHLLNLAMAYGTKGTSYYKNEKLKNDIISGLDWLYENLYGEDEINGRGWRSIKSFNWYQWYQTVPQAMGNIFIIMKPEIGMENIRRYYALFAYIKETWQQGNTTDLAQSRVASGLRYAVITENAKEVADRLKDLSTAINTVQSGDGYREDYSYIYHDKYPYATMYGVNSLCTSLIPIINIFAGTKFQFASENRNNIANILFDTYAPLMHNGRAMSMFSGRVTLYDDDIYNGAKILKAMYLSIGMFGREEDLKFKQLIKMHISDENIDDVFALMSIGDMEGLTAVLEDESIKPPENYEECKVYWAGDRVIQKRNGYTVGIALSSERLGNYESINTDGQMLWFTGDGALYVYNNGPMQFGANFKHTNYERIPGTTEDTREREPLNISASQAYLPESDFVGGVQFDNDFATVGMDFVAFNNIKESSYTGSGYGGGLPVFESTLKAKKAWFLFDDEIVALGAGISANEGSDIRTYIDNRLLYKNTDEVYGVEDVVINGEKLEKVNAYTKEFKNPSWAYVESEGGYYFPSGGTLTVNKRDPHLSYLDKWFIHSATRTHMTASWLEMWLEHGKNPDNSSYSYVVLPNKTAEESKLYSENPDISILANTSKIQAVKENGLNLTGIIFYEKGSYGTLSVSEPLIVMAREKNEEYILKISDPTHKLTTATVTVNKDMDLVSCDDIISIKKNGKITEITLDLSEKKGQTFTAEFKIK